MIQKTNIARVATTYKMIALEYPHLEECAPMAALTTLAQAIIVQAHRVIVAAGIQIIVEIEADAAGMMDHQTDAQAHLQAPVTVMKARVQTKAAAIGQVCQMTPAELSAAAKRLVLTNRHALMHTIQIHLTTISQQAATGHRKES
jgi:hypothetical protein